MSSKASLEDQGVSMHQATVNVGMTQALTGLGILLGTGAITIEAYTKIVALIHGDKGHDTGDTDDAGESGSVAAKETPDDDWGPGEQEKETLVGSWAQGDQQKETPDGSFWEQNEEDKEKSKGGFWSQDDWDQAEKQEATSQNSSHYRQNNRRVDDVGGIQISLGRWSVPPKTSSKAPATLPSKPDPSSSPRKVVCPYWLTEGYHCRDDEAGQCTMYHERIPDGLQEPLICYFWARGNRCNKSKEECRFAHYYAQHRIVAPMPMRKKTKPQASSSYETGGYTVWPDSTTVGPWSSELSYPKNDNGSIW
ncbi:hypothetical protein Hte_001774 [Hypoxylon texense]